MKKKKRLLAITLSLATAASLLSGCGLSDVSEEMYESKVDKSKTVTKNSKWINSDLVGAVTEDTNVSLKDDFYTAANKDWFLEVEDRVKEEGSVSDIEDNSGAVLKNEIELLNQAKDGTIGDNKIGMDEETYDHLRKTFATFANLAGDWETRDEEGTMPLEQYITQIEDIDSLEGLTEYLTNSDGSFISGAYPIKFSVDESWEDETKYTVMIQSNYEDYSSSTGSASDAEYHDMLRTLLAKLLKDYGYSESDVSHMLKNCWKYEAKLSQISSYEKINAAQVSNAVYFNNIYNKEDLKELAGDYPLFEILSTYDYDNSDDYTVWEPNFVKGVGKLYTEKNLQMMKDYFLVHTIINSMQYLSKDYYEEYQECFESTSAVFKSLFQVGSADDASSDSEDADDQSDSTDTSNGSDNEDGDSTNEQTKAILNDKDLTDDEKILLTTVTTNLSELTQEMYVANYCSTEQKEYLENMVADLIDSYREILNNEEWLPKETRQKAIEKLEKMTIRVLYPDNMNDYKELDLTDKNLVQSVAAVRDYNLKKNAEKINQKVNKKDWNFLDPDLATTTTNAYYRATDNSAMILAGVVASDNYFSLDASYEENLSHIGVIMGHEISHAFDTTGYMFDADGNLDKWWGKEEEDAFQDKADKLAKYYSTYTAYRGGEHVDGENVEGEAIADIGGMKCVLNLSKKTDGFDYEKFFLSYAKTFVISQTVEKEVSYLKDVHPMSFLRCNIVVQQFDEFYDTFDIKEGDGMYLAPEDRVAVW